MISKVSDVLPHSVVPVTVTTTIPIASIFPRMTPVCGLMKKCFGKPFAEKVMGCPLSSKKAEASNGREN